MKTLTEDTNTISLLAKWIASENTSSKSTKHLAKDIRTFLNLSPKEYRKTLSILREKLRIVERDMCANKWDTIEYSAVPSKAALNYKNAFVRHDSERYNKYLQDVSTGVSKINSSTLYPYDIIAKVWGSYAEKESTVDTLDLLWKALPNYLQEDHSNGLVVADVSGSMSGLPMQVSISLALYISERNKGLFKDHFITFSEEPTLQQVIGSSIKEKVLNVQKSVWGMNTNLESVFTLILDKAVSADVDKSEMPSKIFIISDMEFDEACNQPDKTLFEVIDNKYAVAGYTRPELVFWNVKSSSNNMPVRFDARGVCLVSGCSPVILKSLLGGTIESPIQVMLDTLNTDRYNRIIL